MGQVIGPDFLERWNGYVRLVGGPRDGDRMVSDEAVELLLDRGVRVPSGSRLYFQPPGQAEPRPLGVEVVDYQVVLVDNIPQFFSDDLLMAVRGMTYVDIVAALATACTAAPAIGFRWPTAAGGVDRMPALSDEPGPDGDPVTAMEYDDPESLINRIDGVLDQWQGSSR